MQIKESHYGSEDKARYRYKCTISADINVDLIIIIIKDYNPYE